MAQVLRYAPPRTSDDVSIAPRDGQRLDNPEKVRAWVAQMNAEAPAPPRRVPHRYSPRRR